MTDSDFIYIADNTDFKSVGGSITVLQPLTFCVKLSRRFFAYNIIMVLSGAVTARLKMVWKDFIKGYDVYRADFCAQSAGLIYYHFEIDTYGRLYYAGRGKSLRSKLFSKEEFTLLVYNSFETPDSIKGGIMYHVFVDRFYRGRQTPVKPYAVMHKSVKELPVSGGDELGVYNYDFFGGNISGITEKLPYISSLGVNCIVLSPVFEAFSNHKYDVGDFEKIDMMFGSEQDFIDLAACARKLGIIIIIDGVFNHTGSDSKYFNSCGSYGKSGACHSKDSPYYEWYTFKKYPDIYECWWGIKTLPQIKKDSFSYQNYIAGEGGVLHKWLNNGAGGVRLDVADELSNAFLEKINGICKSVSKEVMIIGEVWEDAAEKWSYGELKRYFWGRELDSVMNYPFRKAVIDYLQTRDCTLLAETLQNIWDKYPRQVCHCLMNILGTHDTPRILTELANDSDNSLTGCKRKKSDGLKYKNAVNKLKIAALIQYTVYGVPCIYYGDERGMYGGDDPFNRKAVVWEECCNELFDWYRKLAEIRKLDVFKCGEFKELYRHNGVYVYKRYNNNSTVIIAVNMSEGTFTAKTDNCINLLNGTKNDIISIKSDCFAIVSRECR